MKHQDIIARLVAVSGIDETLIQQLTEYLPSALADLLKEGGDVAIPGFGTFSVHKRLERIVENPATGRRTLTPPRLVLRYQRAIADHPRFTLHDLSTSLARKSREPQATALQFTAQCFGTIHEALQQDGFASLKGLGTFHIDTTSASTSQKVEYSIDDILSTLINRPFAELPEVEIADDTALQAFETINEEFAALAAQEAEPSTETQVEATANSADSTSEEHLSGLPSSEDAEPNAESTTEFDINLSITSSDQVAKSSSTSLNEKEADKQAIVAQTGIEDTNSLTNPSEDTENESEASSMVLWKRMAVVFGVAFIALLLFTLLHIGRGEMQPASDALSPSIITTDSVADSTMVTPAVSDTARVQIIHVANSNEVFTQFEPDGVLDEHTIVLGDMLMNLAKHYYGNPYFAKYIIEYNGLPADGTAAIGTVIKIPHLKRKDTP